MKKLAKIIAVTGIVAGLGVAALPIASHAVAQAPIMATDSANVQVRLEVSDAISIAFVDPADSTQTISAANVNLGTLAPNTVTNITDGSNKVTVLVKSNNQLGYFVSASGDPLTNTNNDTIPFGTVTPGTSAYGMSVSNSDFYDLTYIGSTNKPSNPSGDTFDLYFGASVSANQPTGTYTGTVTIFATNSEPIR